MASMLINLFKNVFKSDDISNDSTQEANRGVSSVATTRVSVQMGNITSSQVFVGHVLSTYLRFETLRFKYSKSFFFILLIS